MIRTVQSQADLIRSEFNESLKKSVFVFALPKSFKEAANTSLESQSSAVMEETSEETVVLHGQGIIVIMTSALSSMVIMMT